MTATYEDGREMGTALKVELGFRRRRVHLIGAYVPTASTTNMADCARTQQIVHGWLTAALDAGDEFILVGDLNEHLFAENRANPTQLGRYLRTSPEVKEVWQACPRTASLPGHTFPRNTRCHLHKLDFTYVSASLAHGVRQAALMRGQSAIDEDHYALFAEVSVPWAMPGPATTKGNPRPHLRLRQQGSDLQDRFRVEVDARLTRDTGDTFEETLYQAGRAIFGTARQPTGPIAQSKVQRASWTGKKIRQMAESGNNRREEVWQLITACEELLPDGIPPTRMAEIERLLAEPCPRRRWIAVLRPHANYLRSRLQQVTAREAQMTKIRRIRWFTHRRNERFGSNFGQILKMLNKPRESSAIDRVVMADGTLETDPHMVEKRTSEHFFTHFDVNQMASMMVQEEWAEYYPQIESILFQAAGSPITQKELDWYISRAPRRKAPGKSGVPFELLQMLSDSARERLRAELNKALETGKVPATWKTAVICPIPKKPGVSGQLAQY
ncbi:hypothetical protein IW147_003390 [Coemansia sp. RSA 720]|nr:hypothetical protein IW147_003390 [Coemansia sp. RSA 720]